MIQKNAAFHCKKRKAALFISIRKHKIGSKTQFYLILQKHDSNQYFHHPDNPERH